MCNQRLWSAGYDKVSFVRETAEARSKRTPAPAPTH